MIDTYSVLVQFIEQQNISHVFGLPGEENLLLINALSNSTIETVITHHEQAAGFMAANYARISGKTGVSFSTLGPGATNLATSFAYAKLCQLPVLFVIAQKSRHSTDLKTDPFQYLDLESIYKPLSKKVHTLDRSDDLKALIYKLINISSSDRKGPVALIVPENIQHVTHPDSPTFQNLRSCPSSPHLSNELEIKRFESQIANAQRPIFVVGGNDLGGEIYEMLTHELEHKKIPFVSTQMGKSLITTNSSSYKACLAVGADDCVNRFLKKADLVIFVGCSIPETPLHDTLNELTNVIWLGKGSDIFNIDQSKCYGGNISSLLGLLGEKMLDIDPSWMCGLNVIEAEEKVTKNCNAPETIVEEFTKFSNPKTQLCLDNGLYKLFFARNLGVKSKHGLILDNALATMGAGIPSAIACKLADQKREVIAITGDGGFLMCLSEIETAKRYNIDITIVVLVDNSYGMIKWKQKNDELSSFGMDFETPNIKSMADAFGIKHIDISDFKSLSEALQKCNNIDGVKIMDIPIDYSSVSQNLPKSFRTKFEKEKK